MGSCLTTEMQNDEFFLTFLEEAIDILADWEKHCLGLDRGFDKTTVDALFRSAHNLKGSSRSVGLDTFGGFVHKTEDVISALRVKAVEFSPLLIKTLLEVHSVLTRWRDHLKADRTFIPREEIASLEATLSKILSNREQKIQHPGQIEGFELFSDIEEKPKANQKLDLPNPTSEKSEGSNHSASPAQNEKAFVAPKPANKNLESIRVPSQKIDALMQIVGELSTQQAIISHSRLHGVLSSKASQNAIQISAKLTKELQHQTLGLRMQSLSSLFQRLERTIRDLARDQSKPIDVVLEGEDVELDKSIIERVTDTLVHIVRNAVDHGIEKPDVRKSVQKPEKASISLCATQDSNVVTIQVKDDGRGIDAEKVKRKAIEKGLIKSTDKIEGHQVYDLLLLPGFSTADQVSEVSGRGVGLDVVNRTVDSLGGSMTIDSIFHQGSVFSISLPISVSIVDGLVFELESSSYVVPIHEVEEVINTKMYKKEMMTNSTPMIMLRGRAIAVIQLATFLPTQEDNEARRRVDFLESEFKDPAFIVEARGHKVALCFDRIIGQQSIVVRRLPEKIKHITGFRGSTILSNGEPAIIISPRDFARNYISGVGDMMVDSSLAVNQKEAG
jgi:two-component system chemotaxis sensor kinase CheA